MSLNTQVGRVVLEFALFESWLNPSLKVKAGSLFLLATPATCGNLPIWSRLRTVSPSLRFRYPKVAWFVILGEKTCSQLKRAMGEFWRFVVLSFAIAAGSEELKFC